MAVRFGYEQPCEALPLGLVVHQIGIDIQIVHSQFEGHA